MKMWAAYVHTGKATTDQEAKVRKAYERYQLSMNAVIDVGKSATTTTNNIALEHVVNTAVAAQTDLVNLVQSFTKK